MAQPGLTSQVELVRVMIQLVLLNRSTIYLTPALADVANNKGDRINKKIQSILARMTAVYPWADGMVKEEVAKISAAKPWKRKAGGVDVADVSPSKKANKSPSGKQGRGKKEIQVVKVEAEEDELESEES